MPPTNASYDFITNPTTSSPPPRLSRLGGNSSSMSRRLVIVGGGGLILVILAIVIYSFISNIGKGAVTDLARVAQLQDELSGIGQVASTNVSSQVAKNLAANTQYTMISAEQQYLGVLKSDGLKLSTKQTTGVNTAVNTTLTNAASNGEYDSVFVQAVQNQIATYISALQQAFIKTSVTNQKAIISNLYNEAKLLNSEASSAAQNLT